MKLTIVRHGETVENLTGIIQGHQPGKLTELGLQQGELVAQRLRDQQFDVIYSSDLGRAVDTCNLISRFHEIPTEYSPLLRERGCGVFEGGTVRELAEAEENGGLARIDFTPEGGESFRDLYNRSVAFLDFLHRHYDREDILIVSHGGWNRMVLGSILNKTIDESLSISQRNTCVNIVEYEKRSRASIQLMNCTTHLD
jgi:phosphoserine phosphatase